MNTNEHNKFIANLKVTEEKMTEDHEKFMEKAKEFREAMETKMKALGIKIPSQSKE